MQKYTTVSPTTKVRDSLTTLTENDLTVMSNSSGTSFPTADLQVGMKCHRTDENVTYTLMSLSPAVWRPDASLNSAMRSSYPLEVRSDGVSGMNGRTFVLPAALHASANMTGAYVIKLSNVTAMHSARIRVFNYGGDATKGLVEFLAMLYSTGSALAVKYLSHLGTLKVPVRYCLEKTTNRRCIIVGDVTTIWGFPKLDVLDVSTHRSTISPDGAESVSVVLETSLDSYTMITAVDDTGPYASAEAAQAKADSSFQILPPMAANEDLNLRLTSGRCSVATNAIAASLKNGPPGVTLPAGVFDVFAVSSSVQIQTYTSRDGKQTWQRGVESGVGQTWVNLLSETNGLMTRGVPANGTDFDTLTSPGIYNFNSNANLVGMANSPAINQAGKMTVTQWGGSSTPWVIQEYATYGAIPRKFTRSQNSATAWSLWREFPSLDPATGQFTSSQIPDRLLSKVVAAAGENSVSHEPISLPGTSTDTTVNSVFPSLTATGRGNNAGFAAIASGYTSTRFGARFIGARTPGVGTAFTALPNAMTAASFQAAGADGVDAYRLLGSMDFISDGTVTPTDSKGRWELRLTPTGSVVPQTVVSVTNHYFTLMNGLLYGASQFGGSITVESGANSRGAVVVNHDLGGAWARWKGVGTGGERGAGIDIDSKSSASAYAGMRWARRAGNQYVAAIDALETADPANAEITMHLATQDRAWAFTKDTIRAANGNTVAMIQAPNFTGVTNVEQLRASGYSEFAAVSQFGGSATFKGAVAFQSTVSGVTKAHVGLNAVDNTSDANKPVSTPQATRINAVEANANNRVPIRSGYGGYGYCQTLTGHNVQFWWDNNWGLLGRVDSLDLGRIWSQQNFDPGSKAGVDVTNSLQAQVNDRATIATTNWLQNQINTRVNQDSIQRAGWDMGNPAFPYMSDNSSISYMIRQANSKTIHQVVRANGYIEWATDAGAVGTNYFNSDARKKLKIKRAEALALEKLRQFKFYSFYYREGVGEDHETHHAIGILAQQAQKIDPTFIKKLSDGYLMPQPLPLLAMTMKAVAELDARIEELDRKLKAVGELTEIYKKLEARLAA